MVRRSWHSLQVTQELVDDLQPLANALRDLVGRLPELMCASFVEAFEPEWDVIQGADTVGSEPPNPDVLRCRIGSFAWQFPLRSGPAVPLWDRVQQQAMVAYMNWICGEIPAVDIRPGDTLELRVAESLGERIAESMQHPPALVGAYDIQLVDVTTMEDRYPRRIAAPWPFEEEERGPVDPEDIPDVTDRDRERWARALDTTPTGGDIDSGGGMSAEELSEAIGQATKEWEEVKEEW